MLMMKQRNSKVLTNDWKPYHFLMSHNQEKGENSYINCCNLNDEY
jgi:hypothetical protein